MHACCVLNDASPPLPSPPLAARSLVAALAALSPGRDLTLGFFEHDDGVHQAVIVANYDPVFADRPRVTFTAKLQQTGGVLEVDQSTGRWVALRPDDAGAGAAVPGAPAGVAISLPAGGGRLFVMGRR